MRILFALRIPLELEAVVIDDNVIYRPDLGVKGPHALRACLARLRPDVVIAEVVPPRATLEAWRALSEVAPTLIVIAQPPIPEPATSVSGVDVHFIDGSTKTPWVEALGLAEQIHRARLAPQLASRPGQGSRSDRIAIIGAGAVNLVTALYLAEAGHPIEIYDAAPDPRDSYDWRAHGSTFGGGDARIFSLNETRHHHHQGLSVDARTNTQFQRTIAEDGWLVRDLTKLAAEDLAWIREFERVPSWLAVAFDRDLIAFNRDSLGLWRQLMDSRPKLFERGGFRDGLLRAYATRHQFDLARVKEAAIGAVRREIELDRLATEFPSLREAVEAGQIQGALDVVGFSVNVHAFCRAVIRHLAEVGARFHWNTRVETIVRDKRGQFAGLACRDHVIEARHYVLSTGAFGNELLRHVGSEQASAAVIGMWAAVPDLSPRLERPMKLARIGFASSAAAGANAVAGVDDAGREVIYISSGHGFVGTDPDRLDPRDLDDLSRAVDETAQRYFPSKYARAIEEETYDASRRYCIRPWTPTGLGSFEIIPHDGGGYLIVSGGNSTGGFAQAPSIAQAVMAALEGRPHAMHSLYHPRRLPEFLR